MNEEPSTSTTPTSLTVVTNLLGAVKIAEEGCISKQWRFKRKNGKGENFIVRDVLGKLIRLVQRFKQIGDTAM